MENGVGMDRNKYLTLCKECAMMCDEGMYHMKINVPESLQVEFNGAKYYPVGYELSYNKDGTVCHEAIIHDLKANSICHVPLKDLK